MRKAIWQQFLYIQKRHDLYKAPRFQSVLKTFSCHHNLHLVLWCRIIRLFRSWWILCMIRWSYNLHIDLWCTRIHILLSWRVYQIVMCCHNLLYTAMCNRFCTLVLCCHLLSSSHILQVKKKYCSSKLLVMHSVKWRGVQKSKFVNSSLIFLSRMVT